MSVVLPIEEARPDPDDSAPLLPKQCVLTDPSFRRHRLSDGVAFRTSPPPGKAAAAVKEMKTAAEQHKREGGRGVGARECTSVKMSVLFCLVILLSKLTYLI